MSFSRKLVIEMRPEIGFSESYDSYKSVIGRESQSGGFGETECRNSMQRSESPRTPPGSYSIIMERYTGSDHLNSELRNEEFSDLFKSQIDDITLREIGEICSMNAHYSTLKVQSTMKNSHLTLEFVASLCLNFMLCNNAFMFALVELRDGNSMDIVLQYILAKLINLSCVGLISCIFTSPDTNKSVNVTLEYLAINTVVYKYKFSNILKYLAVYIAAGITAALLSVLVYHDLINTIPTKKLLSNMFSSNRSYKFNYSYILVSVIMHALVSVGLTMITNTTSSINSKRKAIQKAGLTIFASITFGIVVGPVGYVFPNLALYCMIVVTRNDYSTFDLSLFATYTITLFAIVILYPIIAIQIKFVWRNKYRRYVEYGL